MFSVTLVAVLTTIYPQIVTRQVLQEICLCQADAASSLSLLYEFVTSTLEREKVEAPPRKLLPKKQTALSHRTSSSAEEEDSRPFLSPRLQSVDLSTSSPQTAS